MSLKSPVQPTVPLLETQSDASESPQWQTLADKSPHFRPPYGNREMFRLLWDNEWVPETMSCFGSLVALLCLLVTLRHFDGYALVEIPLMISINAWVAIFADIVKSSLLLPIAEGRLRHHHALKSSLHPPGISQLKWSWFSHEKPLLDFARFDSASRGPWGSFLLIYHLPGRYVR